MFRNEVINLFSQGYFKLNFYFCLPSDYHNSLETYEDYKVMEIDENSFGLTNKETALRYMALIDKEKRLKIKRNYYRGGSTTDPAFKTNSRTQEINLTLQASKRARENIEGGEHNDSNPRRSTRQSRAAKEARTDNGIDQPCTSTSGLNKKSTASKKQTSSKKASASSTAPGEYIEFLKASELESRKKQQFSLCTWLITFYEPRENTNDFSSNGERRSPLGSRSICSPTRPGQGSTSEKSTKEIETKPHSVLISR